MLAECQAEAIKRVISWQLEKYRKRQTNPILFLPLKPL